jgi:hypothetical protein
MLYAEVELRHQRRKKNVVVLPVTVTSRRSYGEAGTTRSNTRRKKKEQCETRLGASLEELSLEIEGTALKVEMRLTSEICLARLICIITGRGRILKLEERGRYCTVEHLSG